MKFRKRVAEGRSAESSESVERRNVRNLINSRSYPEALAIINDSIAESNDEVARGRLLRLAGDASYKQGFFSEAADIYRQAVALTLPDQIDWFSPKLAEIRALLKQVQLDQALQKGRECVVIAEQKEKAWFDLARGADALLAQGQIVRVPFKPHRVSVVATEVGELFLSEGEIDSSVEFLNRAISNNPRGGCRARQALAEIALRQDKPDLALQRASEALILGKFQAKTISAWKLLFAAKRKLGDFNLPAEIVAGWRASIPTVRARALLAIVKELRAVGSPQWQDLANEWIQTDGAANPTIAAEIRKLILADAKIGQKPSADLLTNAQQVLATPGLAFNEWLSAGKVAVKSTLIVNGDTAIINTLVAEGIHKFGKARETRIRHSFALASMMARKYDVARQLLNMVQNSAVGGEEWNRSIWALARMENFLGNHSQAATLYKKVADNGQTPDRFRLQANLEWAKALITGGNIAAIDSSLSNFKQAIKGIRDPDILMDFGRQLRFSGHEALAKYGRALVENGCKTATAQFATTPHPSAALKVLFHLTRRQYYDISDYEGIVSLWTGLTDEKKTWLWSNSTDYWSYISLVSRAYARLGKYSDSFHLSASVLDDSSTPREGLIIVGSQYYVELCKKGEIDKAMEGFSWLATEAPDRLECSEVFYWMGLVKAKQSNDLSLLFSYGRSISSCIGGNASTFEFKSLAVKALLFCSGLSVDAVVAKYTNYPRSFIESRKSSIISDIENLVV